MLVLNHLQACPCKLTPSALSEDCAGADAYMVIEDPNSGEVGTPSFLIRLGIVPEFDDF